MILVLGGIPAGCGSPANDPPKETSKGTILFPNPDQTAQEQRPRVKLIRVTQANWNPELVAAGTISPFRAGIKSAIHGRIIRISVKEGDEVTAGQKALELDPAPILEEIETATSLRNRLNQKIQLATERISLNNQTKKITQAPLPPPPSPYTDTSDSDYSTDMESENLQLGKDLQEFKKQLAQTGKKLENLERNQENTSLTCPINGTIEILEVSTGDTVIPGKALVIIKNVKQLEMNLLLPKHKKNFILKAKGVEVKIESFPGEVFFGDIVRTSIYILPDEKISVKIRLPHYMGKILPGMKGTVVIAGQELENVCLLPVGAIREDARGKFAYQFINGKIIRKSIELGQHSKKVAVITSGLKEGALVVANPTDDLKPLTRVIPDITQ